MLIADAVYTACVDAGKPILLDIVQEDSREQRGLGGEHNELVVPNKNKKGNARSNNKNQKKKRENKDNATGNVSSGNKRKTRNAAVGGIMACFVACVAAYSYNNKRKRKKEKSENGKKESKK